MVRKERRKVRKAASSEMRYAINDAREMGTPVISLDIPSGLPGDIDEYDSIGPSVHASHTVAFHCCKQIHNNKPAVRAQGKRVGGRADAVVGLRAGRGVTHGLSMVTDLDSPP